MTTYSSTAPNEAQGFSAAFWLSLLCFGAYAMMLIGLSDVTFHTVDAVRDVKIARAIAEGREFPTVSQPWAAKFQTPPGYVYLLSLPFLFGGDERVAFFFVAVLCLSGVLFLWRTVWSRIDPTTATVFAATSIGFPTSIFLHSVGNAPLAFAASCVALACVIRIAAGARGSSFGLVLMLALLPQLHLSSLPIVFAICAWLVWRIRLRMTPAAIMLALLLLIASAIWMVRFGHHAPEYQDSSGAIAATMREIVSRALNVNQWYRLVTTYLSYAKGIVGVPSWLVVCVIVVTAYFVIAVAIAFALRLFWRKSNKPTRLSPVLAITVFTIFASVAYLEAWGVWYFDPLFPWVAVSAATGVVALVGALNGAQGKILVFAAILACANLVPQIWLHRTLARYEFIEFRVGELVGSANRSTNAEPTPIPSARTLLAYRDRLASIGSCPGDVVGVAEWYLRDLTLRDAYSQCPQTTNHIGVATARVSLDGFDAVSANSSASLTLHPLPIQRIRINGEYRSSIFGTTLVRYGFYAPMMHTSPPTIEIESVGTNPQTLRIALRCLDVKDADALAWRMDNIDVRSKGVVIDRSMLSIRYMEFEFVISPLREGAMRIQPQNAKQCDLAAFTLQPRYRPRNSAGSVLS